MIPTRVGAIAGALTNSSGQFSGSAEMASIVGTFPRYQKTHNICYASCEIINVQHLVKKLDMKDWK